MEKLSKPVADGIETRETLCPRYIIPDELRSPQGGGTELAGKVPDNNMSTIGTASCGVQRENPGG
jgi:hypothetical protein